MADIGKCAAIGLTIGIVLSAAFMAMATCIGAVLGVMP